MMVGNNFKKMEKTKSVSRKIKKKELQSVLNTMVFYKRKFGYMAFRGGNPDGKLEFYDSDPIYNGKGSVQVTQEDLLDWIKHSKN